MASNLHLQQNLLQRDAVMTNRVDTTYVERHLSELLAAREQAHPHRYFAGNASVKRSEAGVDAPPGTLALNAPNAGVLVSLAVAEGDTVAAGQPVAVLEAMKMEFEIRAEHSGIVRALAVAPGDALGEGQALLFLEPAEVDGTALHGEQAVDLAHVRADLAEVLERHARLTDARRPEAVARRRKTGQRTVRENLADMLDDGSFIEYGAMALAAQRRRRSPEELLELSPADGLVAGIGTVNAAHVGAEAARCMAIAYDYTVFAGTQGVMNHKKTDRMLALAEQWRLPVVLFAEGGGGRPGDTDFVGVAGLDCHTFVAMARLSALVPTVGVVSGRCFAGNAALLGCCDVIIATQGASIGMAGPAMIEGGGLGRYTPEQAWTDRGTGPQRGDRRAGGGRSRSGRSGETVPGVLPGAAQRLAMQRSPRTAPDDPGEPPARVRHPQGDRTARRPGQRAGAAPPVRPRPDHRADPHRGQALRSDRQQPRTPGRCHRCRGRRQGRTLPATVRGP